MSVGPEPPIDINLIEQARKQINRLAEEIASLSEQDLAPPDYYGEFLQRLMTAIAAPAGAVWLRTAQGNLQLQYQVNLREVGIDQSEETRQAHDELLRQAILKGQPGFFPPHSSLGQPEDGKVAPGNPTNRVILIAPIVVEKQVAGLVEIWQDPNRGPEAQKGFLKFMVRMAGLASSYTRNQQLRQMSGQQQVWTQLETFSRQIHASLNPTEVAYVVANEGRRLIDCDRVSVGIRRGKRVKVEAISGADVVEKRSNLVQLMRILFDKVLKWGERLVYQGVQDDTLPPDVLKALDEYLAESNSKVLVILPCRDEREADTKRPARSIIMMECFDPSATPDQLIARLEVVSKHATSALYNAAEHRRIPMRFLWSPIAKVQEGLGGKARAILALIGVCLVILIGVMVFVPSTLKVEAKGELLPRIRGNVYARIPSRVVEFPANINPNSRVNRNQNVARMYSAELAQQIVQYKSDFDKWEQTLGRLRADEQKVANSPQATPQDKANLAKERIDAESKRNEALAQLNRVQRMYNADLNKPGEYWLTAPMSGVILNSSFREKYKNRTIQPNEPILRIGQTGTKVSDWEIEMRIPQKSIGQVLSAFAEGNKKELDVDLLLLSAPTQVFKGKLARVKVSPQAAVIRDDNNESEPVVVAWVRISGDDIPPGDRLPRELLLTGTEVHAKVRCGQHALGYTLFYGVWEWMYEKIIFFF